MSIFWTGKQYVLCELMFHINIHELKLICLVLYRENGLACLVLKKNQNMLLREQNIFLFLLCGKEFTDLSGVFLCLCYMGVLRIYSEKRPGECAYIVVPDDVVGAAAGMFISATWWFCIFLF